MNENDSDARVGAVLAEVRRGIAPSGASAPLHAPRACRSCSTPVFWAALLDDRGNRLRRADGRGWRSITVEAQPDPAGTLLLAHREGEGIVCRVLSPGDALPPGGRLRRRHPYPCGSLASGQRSCLPREEVTAFSPPLGAPLGDGGTRQGHNDLRSAMGRAG